MFYEIPLMFHVIMLLSVISAFAGLWCGLGNRRREIDDDVKSTLAWTGIIITCIIGLILAFAQLSAIGYEVGGLMFCLSLLIGFLGIGLCIGPARAE
jgi:hypothetical protein